MYPVSDAWKTAIKNKAEQRIMLVYPDCILLRENISMDGGVEYTEILNADTDLNMGKAVMAGFNCRIVNNGEIPETCFTDEFTPMIGVCTEQTFHAGLYDSYLTFTHTIDGNEETVTITSENGVATVRKSTSDDAFAFETSNAFTRIAYISGALYLKDAFSISMFLDPGYGDNTWEYKGIAEDTLMLNRLRYYFSVVSAVYVESGKSLEYIKTNDGFLGKRFDFIPLGKFTPERPQKIKSKYVDMQAYDRMNRFEGDASTYLQELNLYDNPKTAVEIFVEICNLCGVGYVSSTFRHDWITLRFDTFRDKEVTFRQILAWIAECGGNSVRINRDGLVEMVSFAEQEHVISKGQQFEAVVSERITPVIDKLEVYTSYTDILTESGSGNNLYQIIDNPFLYAENDGEVDGVTSDIYGWLGNFPAYYPATVRAEADPAVQCGDIIRFMDAGMEKIFPVFALTLTWNGYAKAVYESTGQPKRSNLPTEQRMLANLKKEFLRKADAEAEIESYVNSAEGKASILTTVFGEYTGENPIEDYVTKSDVKAEVTTQVNAMDFTGIISSVISGEYVTENELNSTLGNYYTKTQVSASITQAISDHDATISLTASSSTTSKEVPVGTYIANGDVTYGFTLTSDGYRTSNNKGVDDSFAYGEFRFSFDEDTEVTFRCISYGENNYDYGILSIPNMYLSEDNSTDSVHTYHSFKGESSETPQDIKITIPAGSDQFITFKYIKDGSQSSGGDYFKIKALVMKPGTSQTSTITLKSGSTVISSADITFSGIVTFESLETAGTTKINGANIMTGTLSADMIDVSTIKATELYYKSKVNGAYKLGITSSDDVVAMVIGDNNHDSSIASVQIKSKNTIFGTDGDEYSFGINCGSGIIDASNMQLGEKARFLSNIHSEKVTLMESRTSYAQMYTDGNFIYVDYGDGRTYKLVDEEV